MKAYRTYLTITDAKQIVLSDMPFRVGEKVEIVVLAAEDSNRAERVRQLQELFKETQSLPKHRPRVKTIFHAKPLEPDARPATSLFSESCARQ